MTNLLRPTEKVYNPVHVSVVMVYEVRIPTHVCPEVYEIVMYDLSFRQVDIFHGQSKSPSHLCWNQRMSDE